MSPLINCSRKVYMKNKSNATKRTRNYATVVYPESAPADWVDLASAAKVPIVISPLHDRDINPTGEIKKPHWHVLVLYENVKTYEQAKELIISFGGVGCEIVQSLRGYARYLCHLDNPEKVQYSTDEVSCLFGVDYHNLIGLPTDKYKLLREMKQWINDNNTIHFIDLYDYAAVHRDDWFRILSDNGTIVIKEYLRSKEYKERLQNEQSQ